MQEIEKNVELNRLLAGSSANALELFKIIPYNLSAIDSGSNILEYLCALKIDGTCYKLINDKEKCYLVGRNYEIVALDAEFPFKEKKYIIDVEIIGDDMYLIDLMYMTDADYTFGRRYNLLQLMSRRMNKLGKYNIKCQQYLPYSIIKQKDDVGEGLVFINVNNRYNELHLYKWKTNGNNTIDYEVKEGKVYLREYYCGDTMKENGIYSVDIDTFQGKIRNDKKTSNSYVVAVGVINTSLISYKEGKVTVENVFSSGFQGDSKYVENKLKNIQISFFRCVNTKILPMPITQIKEEVNVSVPVVMDVSPKYTPTVSYQVKNIQYIKRVDVTEIDQHKWVTSIFPSDVVDRCLDKRYCSDRYSVSGLTPNRNYVEYNQLDKINTRKNLAKNNVSNSDVSNSQKNDNRVIQYTNLRYKDKFVFDRRIKDYEQRKAKYTRPAVSEHEKFVDNYMFPTFSNRAKQSVTTRKETDKAGGEKNNRQKNKNIENNNVKKKIILHKDKKKK